jgi:hypothetical protein
LISISRGLGWQATGERAHAGAQRSCGVGAGRATGYANRFDAIRARVPRRPVGLDESGARLNPRPTALGPQTATVVGQDGHAPGAQGNLTGGHSPAWHGAAGADLGAGGPRNAAALSGIKTSQCTLEAV